MRRFLLLLAALGLSSPLFAQTATLSGSIKDIFGAADTSEQVCLTLKDTKADHSGGYQSPVNPRVSGVAMTSNTTTNCKDATGGAYSITLYGNDSITTQNGTATVWVVTLKSKRGGEQTVGTYRFL